MKLKIKREIPGEYLRLFSNNKIVGRFWTLSIKTSLGILHLWGNKAPNLDGVTLISTITGFNYRTNETKNRT